MNIIHISHPFLQCSDNAPKVYENVCLWVSTWIKLSYHLIFEKNIAISSGPRWFLSNTVGCFVPTWACSWETDLKRFPPRWPSFSEQQLSEVFVFRFHQVCTVILLELTFFLFPHCFNFHSFPGIATAHYRSSLQKEPRFAYRTE